MTKHTDDMLENKMEVSFLDSQLTVFVENAQKKKHGQIWHP